MTVRVQTHSVFRAIGLLSIAYFGVPFFSRLFLQVPTEDSSSSSILDAEDGLPDAPFLSPTTSERNFALLTMANILAVFKTAYAFMSSSLSYLVHLPRVAYLPIQHSLKITSYFVWLILQPLQPVLAPVQLAIKIMLTFVVVPLLVVRDVVVLLYPLYIFVGAAVVCGALVGILARQLNNMICDVMLSVRSSQRPVEKKPEGVNVTRRSPLGLRRKKSLNDSK